MTDAYGIQHEAAPVVARFYAALEAGDREALLALVTPSSRTRWGDFSEVIAEYQSIPNPGTITPFEPSIDDDRVLFVTVVDNVTETMRSDADYVVRGYIVTLVRAPSTGWLVHGWGRYVRPDQISNA
ncbi:hypothetical protein ACFT5B_03785 [Luteimicrobium sp. NPDC057192]|uniref:hypothetical protein n=1 Tax=Luteimicrobium sp. NPDC057192 TaxID=3346042 RepID=UPI00363BA734